MPKTLVSIFLERTLQEGSTEMVNKKYFTESATVYLSTALVYIWSDRELRTGVAFSFSILVLFNTSANSTIFKHDPKG